MLVSMMFNLWGNKFSKIEKRTITFDDEDCDMIPELNRGVQEVFKDSKEKTHPLIAQLKDRELKLSKMEKLSRHKR
jgi:hypothetical protein